MALVRCPECNREVSDKAASCPHCGFPAPPKVVEHEEPGKPKIGSRLAVEIPPWEREDLERFKTPHDPPGRKDPEFDLRAFLGKNKRFFVVLGVVALFMMILAMDALNSPPVMKEQPKSLKEFLPKEPPKPVVYQPPKEDRGNEADAFSAAEKLVLALIPTPSTAKFSFFSSDIVERAPYKWRVRSHVDFQNLFGAMIRKRFIVDLTYRGGKWYCDNIDIY